MTRILTALVLIPVVVALVIWAPEWIVTFATGLIGLLAIQEFIRIAMRISPRVWPRALLFLLGVVYVYGPLVVAVYLRRWNPHWLMFALLLSWAGDTAAMYIGKAFGRHKLAPVVSPQKTWEGAAGSVAGALIAGGIYAHFLIPDTPLAIVLLLAVAGNIAGQLGDLAESALKRRAEVKDSGSSLPGHGGWLDRIDSMLFTVPVIYGLVWCVRTFYGK
jgi:phosphatidate cytidylyltransferase